MKTKYAIVGTGGRCGGMFIMPLATEFGASARMVAFCDPSRIRMKYWIDELARLHDFHEPIALYLPEEFDGLLSREKPDVVIVCSTDATHAEYIVRSLKAGCDVIVEKPLAIRCDQLAAIGKAVEETGRNVHVAFNYRWAPAATKTWELLNSGAIGAVKHVHFEYLLDTRHGADYFRRWHARMEHSGGLLVHKATHHFDLVNWWIDSIPETVSAHANLMFYGKANALARGDGHLTRYERYLDPASKGDPFRLDLLGSGSDGLYHEAEKDSGYIRDRNVFRDDIDIYDTMSVIARYRNGTLLTYSLVAYSPHEGFRACFTGDRGRLELTEAHGSHLIMGQSDQALAEEQRKLPPRKRAFDLRLQRQFGPLERVEVSTAPGGHHGADPVLRTQLFLPQAPPGHARRKAGWEQGAASVMLGLGANHSAATGNTVSLNDLLPLRPGVLRLSELV